MDDEGDKARRMFDKLNKNSLPKEEKSEKIIHADFSGTGNFIGDNNIVNFHLPDKRKRIKNTEKEVDWVVITEAQKAELLALVMEIVELSKISKKKPCTHQYMWSKLNGAMDVTTYHNIPIVKFDLAKKFLLKEKAILNGTATAKKKSANWRTARYTAIHARSKEFANGPEKMRTYMAKNFNQASLSSLLDTELEQVYRYVMGWKHR